MNRGGPSSSTPNSAPSSSLSSVEDRKSSIKAKTGPPFNGKKSRGIAKWSDVVTPPNYKPFATSAFGEASCRLGNGAPGSVRFSSGQFQSPSTCSDSRLGFGSLSLNSDEFSESSELANSDNNQDQASRERINVSRNRAPFDICVVKTGSGIRLKTPLLLKNREKRHENKRIAQGPDIKVLRSGMIHLRHYVSVAEQVRIVETCHKLGRGPGGFYQPFYRDGVSKLHLKMMCLGKNWDSQNSKYVDVSPADGAKPLSIPGEFHKLVDRAIRDSHDYLREQSVKNIEETLPSMTPDICIVNFYTKSGRLGLHQDKDESKESLRKGLPVVSISIGDSAEFVYGDRGDLDKAEKVVLESGDVLIFGGSSRHVFHGVTTINGETAPKVLLEESNLLPGRLNLTFRKF